MQVGLDELFGMGIRSILPNLCVLREAGYWAGLLLQRSAVSMHARQSPMMPACIAVVPWATAGSAALAMHHGTAAGGRSRGELFYVLQRPGFLVRLRTPW